MSQENCTLNTNSIKCTTQKKQIKPLKPAILTNCAVGNHSVTL